MSHAVLKPLETSFTDKTLQIKFNQMLKGTILSLINSESINQRTFRALLQKLSDTADIEEVLGSLLTIIEHPNS